MKTLSFVILGLALFAAPAFAAKPVHPAAPANQIQAAGNIDGRKTVLNEARDYIDANAPTYTDAHGNEHACTVHQVLTGTVGAGTSACYHAF